MDSELRDALRDIKENQREGMIRLETKIDASNITLHAHVIASATNHEKVTASLIRAHERIDETDAKIEKHKSWHKEEKAKWWGVWSGLALALVGAFWDHVKKL